MTDTKNEHGKRAARKAPWYANVPGLKILVPPEVREEPLAGEEDDVQVIGGRAIDVSPFDLPGGQLRQSMRAAGRGWYAPKLTGSPSTTRQAEVLNTAVIGNPTGLEGIVNGRDNLSQSMIAYDAPTEYNKPEPREVSSPNVLVCGTVGYAKSSLTKTVGVARPLGLAFRRAVVFDKKDQGGVGEYTGMAHRLGSNPLLFDPSGGGVRLNLLDPMIMRGTGLQGQMELVNAVARIARNDTPATEWEEKATRFALRLMLESWDNTRPVTATDLMPFLGRVPTDEGLTDGSKERFHQAGLSIRFGLENLLETFSGIFEGDTSTEVSLSDKLTVFDVSQLPDAGPAVPTVMAVGHQWLLGRLRRERGWVTNVIYEEGWHMIGGPSARLVKSNQKLSRSLGISNWFVMHKGTDIPKESDGYTVIQEAQTLYAYRQDRPEDARWVQETFGLAPDTTDVLMNLSPGHCIFKYGSNPETHMQHIRSRWEAEVTNTDEGMAGSGAKLQAAEVEA